MGSGRREISAAIPTSFSAKESPHLSGPSSRVAGSESGPTHQENSRYLLLKWRMDASMLCRVALPRRAIASQLRAADGVEGVCREVRRRLDEHSFGHAWQERDVACQVLLHGLEYAPYRPPVEGDDFQAPSPALTS